MAPTYRSGPAIAVLRGLFIRFWIEMDAGGYGIAAFAAPARLAKLYRWMGMAVEVIEPARYVWGDERLLILRRNRRTMGDAIAQRCLIKNVQCLDHIHRGSIPCEAALAVDAPPAGYTRRMSAADERPLRGVLEKISKQLDLVVERLASVEQLLKAPGPTAGEEFDQARARIARERQDAGQEQERAIGAVQRSLAEHDLASE